MDQWTFVPDDGTGTGTVDDLRGFRGKNRSSFLRLFATCAGCLAQFCPLLYINSASTELQYSDEDSGVATAGEAAVHLLGPRYHLQGFGGETHYFLGKGFRKAGRST